MSSPATKVDTVTLSLLATGTQTSQALPVKNRHLSIDASWTGTPTGVFSLQCSFDSGATWRTVPGASVEFTANGNAQPAGSASSAVWNFVNVPGGAWRISYAAGSNTSTATFRYGWGA